MADRYAERQRIHAEYRHVASSAIDRLTDRRVQLPINAGDRTLMKNGGGFVKVTILAELREADDGRRDVTRKGRQHGIELTGSDRDREAARILALIGAARHIVTRLVRAQCMDVASVNGTYDALLFIACPT